MKPLSLFITLLSFTALLQAHGDYRDGYRDGYYDGKQHITKVRYVDVVRSKPIYEDVVTYRRCDAPGHYSAVSHHEGALIGGLIGGIVGHHLDTRHRLHTTVGGAVAGAIIGSKLSETHDAQGQCKVVETRLKGYKNIAYWRGEKIVQISEYPLRKIRVEVPRHHRY